MMNTGNSKKKTKISMDKQGVKVIKVAAFCFAIVSWFATAKGLKSYVFERDWQAYLISFAIQSILFVFNLQLPAYFVKIGNRVPDSQKKKRKNNTYKWVGMQRIIAGFYSIVILASSLFSYVFIVNFVYKDTRYKDSNIILDSNYRKYLYQTEEFIIEDTKAMQIVVNEKVSELRKNIPEKSNTRSDSNTSIVNAQNNLEAKEAICQSAEAARNNAKNNYDKILKRGAASSKINEAFQTYGEAEKQYQAALDELAVAKTTLNNTKQEVENNEIDKIVQTISSQILSTDPEMSVLNDSITRLNELVTENSDALNADSNKYLEIVKNTQELRLAIEKYNDLRILQGNQNLQETDTLLPDSSSDIDSVKELKEKLLSEKVVAPDAESKDAIAEWEDTWNLRWTALDRIVKSTPRISDADIETLESSKSVVDIEILKKYDAQDISDNIDDLMRSNSSGINLLERAFNLLIGEYPALAWFSLALAVFLDSSSLLAGLFIYLISNQQQSAPTSVQSGNAP